MKKSKQIFLGIIGNFTALCWAYSLSTRFTDILFASRLDKLVLFTSILIITTLLSWCFTFVILPFFLKTLSKKTILITIYVSIILTVGLFTFFYKLPAFPEQHTLHINVDGNKSPLSNGTQVEISYISTISFPKEIEQRIPITQFIYDGDWKGSLDNYSLSTDGTETVSLSLERFMQAGVKISFQTGPNSGIVNLNWDGVESEIDLYSPNPSSYEFTLLPGLDWSRADRTRKILVACAILADFLGMIIFQFSIFITLAFFLLRGKTCLRNGKLLLTSILIILITQVITIQINQPVVFENPQLESLIRDTLNKPTGEVYDHQLRNIVVLDASNRGLTDISGIELLPKLIELNLRDNLLTDISPLANLQNLQKINLRGNRIHNLDSLENLEKLEYLNIHSNSNIESIMPLHKLIELKTLIMAGVPLNDGSKVFENLKELKYLNLRASGVEDLATIGNLSKLEYLNLHSNSGINSIQPLAQLKNLRSLILAHVPLNGESETLADLSKVRYLNLRDTGLEDISILSNFFNLEYLNLHSNPLITSIHPLKELTHLEHLILQGVPVGNQTAYLANLNNLKTLNIQDCGITDLSFLGNLMAQGALQDKPHQNTYASLDIRDNPLSQSAQDQFAALRPYWENINSRSPVSLPFFSNLEPPKFSHASGYFQDEFFLSLSSENTQLEVHYTLDNTVPTLNSPIFVQPILITNRDSEANIYSSIEDVSADWNKPKTLVKKAQIVRAAAIDPSTGETSAVITHTYFVNLDDLPRHSLDIVSLVTDPENFFDQDDGIYMLGSAYLAAKEAAKSTYDIQISENFHLRGRQYERPIAFELISSDGKSLFAQNAGVRIHGSSSRQRPQKSLRIIARPEYDSQDIFSYQFFNDPVLTTEPKYETLLLRNAGQDWMISMFRDSMAQSLVSHTELNTQQSKPVIAYLNGEYWGIYHLQERIDEYYLANHYDIPTDKSVILRNNMELFRGETQDIDSYRAMLDFIKSNSMALPDNYTHIQSLMDVDNYIDYLIANIYMGNTDWPHNNLYYWRKTTDTYQPNAPYGHDGRWRWMLFDLDWTFGFEGFGGGVNNNTLKLAQKTDWTGFLFRSLLQNKDFQTAFLTRFCDHINSTFTPERVISFIDANQALLQPEMNDFFARWTFSEDALANWESEVDMMRDFARRRPEIVLGHLQDQFDLDAISLLTLKTDPQKGTLKINSLELDQSLSGVSQPMVWSGSYFDQLPITLTATPNPGFKFVGWDGLDSDSPEITITIDHDMQITAIFAEQ